MDFEYVMEIVLIVSLAVFGLCILFSILFTKKGEYLTSSYKINPYIDKDGCIELVICDKYLKRKSFFVSYKYSNYLGAKNDICVTFIQIPILHWKPRIQDVYINKEKINI